MNKTFCEICRKDVKFKIERTLIKVNVKGKGYEYVGKKAVCKECKREVYVPKVEDINLKKFREVIK